MSMLDIDTFSDLIRPFVKNCPESTIEQAARAACIQLCEQSLVIQSDIAAGDVLTGYDTYEISSATYTQPVQIISLLYNGKIITSKTEDELDRIDYGWRTADAGEATYFIGRAPNTFQLNRVPAADITDGLVPRVATRPTIDASQIDSRLYSEYAETIKYGAIWKLKEMPDQVWSDPAGANFYGTKFTSEIQRARIAVDKGYQRRSTVARPRFFA